MMIWLLLTLNSTKIEKLLPRGKYGISCQTYMIMTVFYFLNELFTILIIFSNIFKFN